MYMILGDNQMTRALYLNGVYESVLEEIRTAQDKNPNLTCYLQPYSPKSIAQLAKEPPTPTSPIPLYLSITTSLPLVSYRARIVGWELKSEIASGRLKLLNEHISTYQPGENEVYMTTGDGNPCANLLAIADLQRLAVPVPVGTFRKLSDDTPLKPRTRPGNWSYVHALPDWVGSVQVVNDELLERFESEVRRSLEVKGSARKERLKAADKFPKVVQTIARSFRRNPDVVATVLERANGACEACHNEAPFLTARDGRPYLEVHHRVMLADGGEDTVDNAMAVCPNCHRRFHFGT